MSAPDYKERNGSPKYSSTQAEETITRVYEVAWADRDQMIDYLMGEMPATLPAEDPEYPDQHVYCDSVDYEGQGKLSNDENANAASYTYAIITAKFRPNPEITFVNQAFDAGIVYRRREWNIGGQYIPLKTAAGVLKWSSDNKELQGVSVSIFRAEGDLREVIPYLRYVDCKELLGTVTDQYDLYDYFDDEGNYYPGGRPGDNLIGKALIVGYSVRENVTTRITSRAPNGCRFELTINLKLRPDDVSFNQVFRPDIATPAYEAVKNAAGSTFAPFADGAEPEPQY